MQNSTDNRTTNNTKLASIPEAAQRTGASIFFIRQGCRNGTIPCVMAGKKYLVNMPLFMELLDKWSYQEKGV